VSLSDSDAARRLRMAAPGGQARPAAGGRPLAQGRSARPRRQRTAAFGFRAGRGETRACRAGRGTL